mmetsp:Transcript_16822/g.14751  ORF Transcript_16822/g.14751 Transcript_16822/m.14751 type:complete len:142 (-) Transcript_16822:822-1247(-)
MLGGFTDKNMGDLWELDISLCSYKGKGDIPGGVWNILTQTGEIPRERRGHTLLKVPGKNKCVLYGGYTITADESNVKEDNDIYVLDISEVCWAKLIIEGIYPEPRAHHYLTFLSPNQFLILGGVQTELGDEKEDSIKFLTS